VIQVVTFFQGKMTVLRKSDQPLNWTVFLAFFWEWPRDTAARPSVCLSCLSELVSLEWRRDTQLDLVVSLSYLSFFVLWCAHVIRGHTTLDYSLDLSVVLC